MEENIKNESIREVVDDFKKNITDYENEKDQLFIKKYFDKTPSSTDEAIKPLIESLKNNEFEENGQPKGYKFIPGDGGGLQIYVIEKKKEENSGGKKPTTSFGKFLKGTGALAAIGGVLQSFGEGSEAITEEVERIKKLMK